MSGFAGLLRLDDGPVDRELLTTMGGRLAYRASDGVRTWISGRAGCVESTFAATPGGEPAALHGRQPRSIRLAAHARIDNRAELWAALGRDVGGDGELIVAAYERWGERCLERLIGDFALALWDGARGRLLLARDPIGLRPLYYAFTQEAVAFGSTIGAVLAGLPAEPSLDRELIAETLRGNLEPWTCRTVYAGLLRLPPSHLLAVERQAAKPRLYYELGSAFDTSVSRSDAEWIESFRQTFGEAVRCRLPEAGAAAILTGGGLDSSALACTAWELASRSAGALELPHLYSLVFERTPAADERDYLRMLTGHCRGAPCRRIPGDGHWALRGWEASTDYPLDEPEVHLMRYSTTSVFGQVAEDGCRVLLAGEGANQVLGDIIYHTPSALFGVGWRDFAAELPYFVEGGWARAAGRLLRAVVSRSLPAALRRRLARRLLRRRPWVRRGGGPAECGLERRFWGSRRLRGSSRLVHRYLRKPYDLARYPALDVAASWAGVELRLPYLDRRVVDLALHLPHRLRSWRGRDRVVLREALAGRMPEGIRTRTSRAHAEQLLERGLKREALPLAEKLMDKPITARLHFVSPTILRRHFDQYRQGRGLTSAFTSFLCVENWLRSRLGRRTE